MFRFWSRILIGSTVLLAAYAASAREVELSVENRIGASDNVFIRQNESTRSPQADGFWEVLPRIALREEQEELTYLLSYRPSYEQYFTQRGINGVDHTARGNVNWQINPIHALGASGNFSSVRRLRENLQGTGSFDPDAAFEGSDRQRVKRARGSLYYVHSFSQRFSGRLDYSFDDLDFGNREINDTRSHTGSAGLNYALSSRTTLGTRLTARFRNSEFTQGFPSSVSLQEIRTTSRTVDVSVSLTRQLTETMRISLSAGPSFIRTDQDNVRAFAVFTQEKSSSRDLSFFAAASINKRWHLVSFDLAYSRFESGGGGTTSSSIVDDVTATVTTRLGRSLTASLRGGWNQREEIADNLTFGGDARFRRWRVSLNVTQRLSPNLAVIGRVGYRSQLQTRSGRGLAFGQNFEDSTIEILTGFLSIQYTFDAFVF